MKPPISAKSPESNTTSHNYLQFQINTIITPLISLQKIYGNIQITSKTDSSPKNKNSKDKK